MEQPFHILIERFLSGDLSQEERRQFLELVADGAWSNEMNNYIDRALQQGTLDIEENAAVKELIYNQILHLSLMKDVPATPTAEMQSAVSELPFQPTVHKVHFLKTAWFRYAAVLLLIAGTAAYLYQINRPQQDIVTKQSTVTPDLPPGGNKAILTLADGSIIILDSAAEGSLTQQGGTKILKSGAGSLAYEPGDENGRVLYNTVSTPNGGQYQITLPDDTKVWLNAASSVRFPTTFLSAREVEITGEAYLEVTNDKNKPFRVKTGGTMIDVLGTSFNINAYGDEPAVKVSLESGSIKIGPSVLKPGQAYLFGKLVSTDIEQDLAWKHGVFNFNNKPFAEVMRQLERWYDIEVIYEKGIPTIQLAGEMTKDVPLKGMLVGLEKLGLKARLQGKQLFVAR